MNVTDLIDAIDSLPPNEREQIKQHLNEPPTVAVRRPETMEEWLALFQDIANEFRGDSTDEEMEALRAAMTLKSIPSEKGL